MDGTVTGENSLVRIGTGFAPTVDLSSTFAPPSDQKAGSMLVFPYYTNAGSADTRIRITNAGVAPVKVHILLLDKSCQQLDYYACITPNGSLTDKASVFDPANTGYIMALAVNDTGQPIIADRLIGNAFVNDGSMSAIMAQKPFGAERNMCLVKRQTIPKRIQPIWC